MLLILMLAVAVLTIALMAAVPKMATQIKRDKEEELIHRGTEYARAIQKFRRKFGRYPTKIEDLENTNNLRFLRRRYKDPMTKEGNWKLLSMADVQQGIANPNFALGPGALLNQQGGNPPPNAQPSPTPSTSGGSVFSTGPGLGGVAGGFMGVASTSTAKSLKEFGGKANYNKWFFIYDPTQDTGKTLLKGPYNPRAFVAGGASNLNTPNSGNIPEQPQTPGQPQSPNYGTSGSQSPRQ